MRREMGEKFNPDKVNLAELERRAGISRAKLRRIKKSGFIDLPHALTGRKAEHTLPSVMTEYHNYNLSIKQKILIPTDFSTKHITTYYYTSSEKLSH